MIKCGTHLVVSRRSLNYYKYAGQCKCSTRVEQNFSPWTFYSFPEEQCDSNGDENSKKRDTTSHY